ncbi:MAG: DUF763 domain-containing protein [Chitinispirillaceae bacterium]|nr:DUF763 domain-containing protein [Chitinispirillaceae bacterium]
MKRSGTADLPLHTGRVPQWLYERMASVGREIIRAVVMEYGTSGVLSRLADPFWFQTLGCVMGMDWHSSGITPSVLGSLKQAVNPLFGELGLWICGGKGKHSLQTPRELTEFASRTGCDGDALVTASRLSAKVDNTCIDDGFQLYHHSFIVSRTGEWAVIQQGMNRAAAYARRYHWHSANVGSFIDDPHTAVIGENRGVIMNLSDSQATGNREGIVSFLRLHPDAQRTELRHLSFGSSHAVPPSLVDSKRLGAVLTLAYDRQYTRFVDALLHPGIGPRTVQALALISEVIYGQPSRFSDPARFTFAHGGKDGHPFPVPLTVYDENISVLRDAVSRARLGRTEKLRGLKILSAMARRIEEQRDPFANVERVIARERNLSKFYGGRTVGGPVGSGRKKYGVEQLSLFAPEGEA